MTNVISSPSIRWSLCASWAVLAALVFVMLGASSPAGWVMLVVAGLMPPVVFLWMWNDGPPPTVAEVLRATEDRR